MNDTVQELMAEARQAGLTCWVGDTQDHIVINLCVVDDEPEPTPVFTMRELTDILGS